jgi:hypothetical protein
MEELEKWLEEEIQDYKGITLYLTDRERDFILGKRAQAEVTLNKLKLIRIENAS